MKKTPLPFALLFILLSSSTCAVAQDSAEPKPGEADPFSDASIDEISRKLENPLTTLWSLTLQENYSIIKGDAITGS